jgi:NADPH:quinone reductase-like Zn-dependent oxidoreductase
MKAAVCRYGPPEVIHIEDVAKPVPKNHEVLIEVGSAAVNPLDGALMKNRPYIARLVTGLPKPRIGIIAGTRILEGGGIPLQWMTLETQLFAPYLYIFNQSTI